MSRKILSIITIISLVLSCLTIVPYAAPVPTYNMPGGVVLDAQFGAGDNGGFELVQGMTAAALTTEPISEGSDNYVLKYTSTDHVTDGSAASGGAEHISIKINGDKGIKFVEGRNIIIETKFKKTNANARIYFKYNMKTKDGFKEEGLNLYSLLAIWHDGKVRYANGATGTNLDQVSMMASSLANVATDWVKAKIVIKGASKLTDVYLSNDAGTSTYTYSNVDIKQPSGRTSLDPSDPLYVEETTHLKTLDFRTRRKDYTTASSSAMDVLVDYLKITQELSYTSSLDKTIIGDDEDIVVSMLTGAEEFEDVSAFYDLYDAQGQLIESEKSFDKVAKKLTINPSITLVAGETYNIKVNKAALLSTLNYIYNSETLELPLRITSCKAENVIIDGRLVAGQFVSGNYRYASTFEKVGETYKWYTAPTIDGPWTLVTGEGSNGQSIEVTETMMADKLYLKMSVQPESTDGVGVETFSNILVPEAAPVVSNLRIAEDTLYTGDTLTALYDYYDANPGDIENGTVIKWYVDGEFVKEGGNLKLMPEYEGKYITFTVKPKNDATILPDSDEVALNEPVGPVVSYLTGSNLFPNPGFETGTTDGIKTSTFPISTFEIITKENENDSRVYSGNYSLYVPERPQNNSTWGQQVTFTPGKTYLVSGMVKSATVASVDGYEGYGTDSSVERPFRDEEKVTINNEEWTRVTLTVVTNENKNTGAFGLLTFTDQGKQAVYVDEMYFGELKITDIVTENIADLVIPESGSTTIKIFKDKILNQFGTTIGFNHETPDVEVISGRGVNIDSNNNIIITPEAVAGEVVLKVSCTPKTTTAASFSKNVSFNLLPNTKVIPSVKDVVVSGDVITGETLSVNYNYHQVENKDDASTFRWFYQDTYSGAKQYIPDATSRTYTVETTYADKFIGCEVTPVALNGETGVAVYSNVVIKPVAPFATNLEITGVFNVGETVNAKYTFTDYNLNNEATSTFAWYISDSAEGQYDPISGQNSSTLELTEAMIGKYLRFEVTPKSDVAPYVGETVISHPFLGPVKPVVSNLEIVKNGTMCVGNYDYYHAHSIAEKGTTYEWYVGNNLVSTNAEFVVNFSGVQTVTFKVTPGCNGNPYYGEPVSITTTIAGNIPQGGFASGGGYSGGGGGGATVVPSINPPQSSTSTDIDNHWGKSYMTEMEKRGVMTPDNDGKYNPDQLVERGDMIVYLYKSLGLTESKYEGGFSDVSADDEFSGMLQTMVNNGTISKYDTFRPNDGISREELCKILYVSLENAGKLVKPTENKISNLADYSTISDWAIDYVNCIYQNGIMIGVSDTEFAPKQNVTKAQVATLLTRILNIIER